MNEAVLIVKTQSLRLYTMKIWNRVYVCTLLKMEAQVASVPSVNLNPSAFGKQVSWLLENSERFCSQKFTPSLLSDWFNFKIEVVFNFFIDQSTTCISTTGYYVTMTS
jgi:hypothetical protein